MQTKSALLLMASLFATSFLYAQSLGFWYSPTNKLDKKDSYGPEHIASDSQGHYFIQHQKGPKGKDGIRFSHFSPDLKPIGSKDFVIVDAYHVGYAQLGDQLTAILEDFDKGKNKSSYWVFPFSMSPSGGNAKEVPVMEFSLEKPVEKHPVTSYAVSKDASKLLITAVRNKNRTIEPSKDELQEIHLAVLDANLKRLWQKNIKLPLPEAEIKITGWVVDNNGDVLMLTEQYYKNDMDKRSARAERESYPSVAKLFKITKASQTPVEIALTQPGKYVSGCTMAFTGPDKLDCACFYSDQPDGNFKGMLLTSIAPSTGKASDEKKLSFDNALNVFFGKNHGKNGKAGLSTTFSFLRLLPQPNGNTLLIAQDIFDYVSGTNEAELQRYYQHRDVVVFELDTKGIVARKALFPEQIGAKELGTASKKLDKALIGTNDLIPDDLDLILGKDGSLCLPYRSEERSGLVSSKANLVAVGILGKDGKTSFKLLPEQAASPKPSSKPFPNLPLDMPMAFELRYKELEGKQWCFELQYLAD